MSDGCEKMSKQDPVKLVASIIFRDNKYLEYAVKKLRNAYGDIEPLTWSGPFDFTDYYRSEFGSPLQRRLLCFKKLVSVSGIFRVKKLTNRIEDKTRIKGNRNVNIDPGYITEAKLVLLTTKDYMHRIYLDRGIYAETTLCYQSNGFKAWPWTYPDYASPALGGYFNEVRSLYRKDLFSGRNNAPE